MIILKEFFEQPQQPQQNVKTVYTTFDPYKYDNFFTVDMTYRLQQTKVMSSNESYEEMKKLNIEMKKYAGLYGMYNFMKISNHNYYTIEFENSSYPKTYILNMIKRLNGGYDIKKIGVDTFTGYEYYIMTSVQTGVVLYMLYADNLFKITDGYKSAKEQRYFDNF